MRRLARRRAITLSFVIGCETSMSNHSECMYWVLSFMADEKIGGFQPIVDSSAEASRAWCVPNSGSSCLPADGAGAKPESCETSLARRMHTNRPFVRVGAPASSVPSVLMRHEMLWVLQD